VEQEIFDRVLAALNTVAGTTYTQEDIHDVCILGHDSTMSTSPNIPFP